MRTITLHVSHATAAVMSIFLPSSSHCAAVRMHCGCARGLECSQLQGASVEGLRHAPVVAVGNLAAAVCNRVA
jgi:hypothetical protein